jgi:hypothetical protein
VPSATCWRCHDGRASSARSSSGALTLTTISRSKSRPALKSRYVWVGRAKQKFARVRTPPVWIDRPAERHSRCLRHAVQDRLRPHLVEPRPDRSGRVEMADDGIITITGEARPLLPCAEIAPSHGTHVRIGAGRSRALEQRDEVPATFERLWLGRSGTPGRIRAAPPRTDLDRTSAEAVVVAQDLVCAVGVSVPQTADSKYKWNQHLGLRSVARVGGRKRGSQQSFLHSRAVDEVDPHDPAGDQPIDIRGQRCTQQGQQDT